DHGAARLPAADEPGRDPAAEALRAPLLKKGSAEKGVRALFAGARKRGQGPFQGSAPGASRRAPAARRNVPAEWRPKRWSRLAMRTSTLTSTRTMPQPSPTSAAADAAGTADTAAAPAQAPSPAQAGYRTVGDFRAE